MSNIFFSETIDKDIEYPHEWQKTSLAPLLQQEQFRQIYAMQHTDETGATHILIDTNADLDFRDEVPLVFSRYEDFDIADIKLKICSKDEADTDFTTVDYQILKNDPYVYARNREYREGNLRLDDQSYKINLRPASAKSPVFRLSAATVCLIDQNRDNNAVEFWTLDEKGEVVYSEKVELSQPFFIRNQSLKAVYLDPLGTTLSFQHTDEKEGTSLGFQGPNFKAIDINGLTHEVNSYKGRPFVLEFWSIHCPWSEVVRAGMNSLIEKHPDLLVLSLSKETDADKINEFMTLHDNKSIVLMRNDSAWQIYNPRVATPMFYLFDQDGRIRFKGLGASMLNILEKLL